MSLLAGGLRIARVREAVEALRDAAVHDPLASLRMYSEGGRLLVRLDGTLVEPVSGQTVLPLDVGALASDAEAIASPAGNLVEVAAPRHGYEPDDDPDVWFERAVAAEHDASGPDVVARHYRRALELDPDHAGALLNLGNVHYNRGDLDEALALYRAAVAAEPGYTEAWYNLANVLDDQGQQDGALTAYRAAIDQDPDFRAAHFNMALVYEKLGDRGTARGHWQRYLDLEPEGPSADIARSFLAND